MENKQTERKFQVVEGLLAKPSKKPDFGNFQGSDVLQRAAAFLPQFIQHTDRLLSDPDTLKKHQMDINIIDKDHDEDNQDLTDEQNNETKTINMDIGVGVYDVLNEDFQENQFKPTSTEPIVRVQGMNNEIGSSSSEEEDSSDDENLYYEFNSSEDDNRDQASITTKSTQQNQSKKRPLIQDITPSKQEEKKYQDGRPNKKRQRTK